MATIWIVEDEERIGLLILAAVKKRGTRLCACMTPASWKSG